MAKETERTRIIPEIWLNRILIVILLVLPLVYFAPLLSGEKMMYGSDWLLGGYASRNWRVESIEQFGAGPLWDPNIFAGLPADNPYNFLTLLYFILPIHVAWTYLFVLSAFLAGLGMYLYLKELKFRNYVSVLSAIAYMGCGSVLSNTYPGHEAKILATGLFPFFLLFLHKGLINRRLIYFLLAGGVGGICAIHAHFQLTYYAGVVCVFYLLCHLIWHRKENKLRGSLKLIIYSVSGLVLAGGLAIIRYLPIFGDLSWGSRGGLERGYEFATSWSLPTSELLDLLTPHFSGILNNYWGDSYFKLDAQYLGILPLLLALIGIIFRIKERYTKFFLGLTIAGTIFALGKYTPLYRIPYYLLPGVNKFRAPSMAFYLTAFGVAVLAAFGLQALVENLKSAKKLALCLAVVFCGVLLFTLVCTGAKDSVLTVLKSHIESVIETNYGPQLVQQKVSNLYQNYPNFLKGLVMSLFFIAISSILIFLLAVKKLKLGMLVLCTLATILIFDQWMIEKKFLKVERHPDEYYAPDGVVDFLKKNDKSIYRVFPLIYEHVKDRYLMYHGIQSVAGLIPNPYHRYQDLTGAGRGILFNAPNLVKYRNLLDILNVKYVIGVWIPEDFSEYDEKTQQMIENFKLNFTTTWGISWEEAHEGMEPVFRSQRGSAVYRNETALPRAWLVPNYEILEKNEVLERMKDSNFDPRSTVILEEDPGVRHQDTVSSVGDAKITSYQPNKISCEVDLTTPGFLVYSENWHPGWKAYVDGVRTKLYIANYCLRAIWLHEGKHTVQLVYDSVYIKAGAWTSSLSFLFLLGVVILFFMQKRRAHSHNRKQK